MAQTSASPGRHNWAGNYRYRAKEIAFPKSVDELRSVVIRGKPLRALGSRHSFNDLADGPGSQVSLENMPQSVLIDRERNQVKVPAAIKYGVLARELENAGLALHNMASLPHISVAGAVATATHGSGDGNGNLATQVSAIEFVNGRGEIVQISRGQTGFDGAVVSLGYLGIATSLTLDIQPSFSVAQTVYQNLQWKMVEQHFDQILSAAYSVSLFTDWGSEAIRQVWAKRRLVLPGAHAPEGGKEVAAGKKISAKTSESRSEFFGAQSAAENLHPLPEISAINCTPQMGLAGPWNERLSHFKLGFIPSNGEELQTEYFVPRKNAIAAIENLRHLSESIQPLLLVSEIRSVAADNLWLSPAYMQDIVALHFTWKPVQDEVEALLPSIERALSPLGGRPHWGKLFHGAAFDFATLYPKLSDFRNLAAAHDPKGLFGNDFGAKHVFGAQS